MRSASLVALLAAALVAAFLHAGIDGPTDPDSLYHVRHAWVYRTEGLWQRAFPWVAFSAIEREASNLWYGFHVLLVPFTLFDDLVVGIRIAAVLVTVGCLMLVWGALARLRLPWPVLGMLVFAFLTADSLYRLTMVRPHPLSLGLAMLLFALLVEDRPPRRTVLGLAALLAWIHLSQAWVPLLVFAVVAGARLVQRKRPDWAGGAFLAGGLLLGALARPNPFGGIRLAVVQVVTWLARKGAAVPLDVGRELRPFGWNHFVDQLLPATLLAIAAAVLVLARRKSIAAWSSLLLTAVFLAMAFLVARRANDLFVAFATVLAACAVDAWRPVRPAWLVLGLFAAAAPFRSVPRYRTFVEAAATVGPERMRATGTWLRDHAQPGEIVFNVSWDTFAHLFYWSPRTYCVSGNDPIFLYARDPELYAIARRLESDAFAAEDLRSIRERFRASYVAAQPLRTPRLVAALDEDARFEPLLRTEREALFRVR